MTQNISFRNAAFYEQKFVISTCHFTFQGYSLLLKQYGIDASHVRFEGDEPSRQDLENILSSQNAQISVFLGKGVVSLLESLKRLACVLNKLPVIRKVTLYGEMPDGWLYRTLGNLLNNTFQLSLIRIASVSDVMTCFRMHNDVFKDNSRSLRDQYWGVSYQENVKGLTEREVSVLLNFYRGMSVKEQCEKMGLSNKTVYTHRKEGVKKLQQIRRWLKDPHAIKNGRKHGTVNAKRKSLCQRDGGV